MSWSLSRLSCCAAAARGLRAEGQGINAALSCVRIFETTPLGCSLTISSPKPIIETGLNWNPGAEQPEHWSCLKYELEPCFTEAPASLQGAQNLAQPLFNGLGPSLMLNLYCVHGSDTHPPTYTQ
ncbi:hypothetical protein KIL84_000015 [Mauremys mutica]|uniref:Uncharacterized protein n=1 Tax=Mauremys mutica TaxID=74926 RepID=A0A9D3XDT9_9SAUR|nr:hypothetical protein KIL84_000015 [Mauremys mutica]